MIGILTLYGAELQIYGNPLALYYEAPAEGESRSGGWLPVIYVDKNGQPVDLAESVEAAIEAAPESERPQALEAAAVLWPDIDKTLIKAEFSAQAGLILDVLRGFDAVLAEMVEAEMKRARQAAIDDEVALILLMAT